MSRRRVSRLVLVVLLVLPFAGAVRAEASELSGPRLTWDWLAGLWEDGISAWWPWSDTTQEKAAGALDPNGGTATATGTTPPPTNGPGQGEQGYGIDPNGTP
ncbi:MAG TPA: hypothetical protein VEL74_21915 [Thermoanaerobaculia bacterium]|nr:hypothetical protein [Thermoanaerobaculia bacterium]